MARLVDDPDSVLALAEQIEAATFIPTAHLEKDLWVTEALRAMAEHTQTCDFELVFKGGTSLSKAFGLIERFSEDIDVLLAFTGTGTAARETAMKGLITVIDDSLPVEVDWEPEAAKGKRRGSHRSVAFTWGTASDLGEAGLRSAVLVELGAAGGTIPSSRKMLRPLLAEYASEVGFTPDFEEARPFDMSVMEPQRTLVEKLMLIHTAASDDSSTETERRRAARHYYDIHQLLNASSVVAAISSGEVVHLARDIHIHSKNAGRASVERPREGFATSPATDISRLGDTVDEYNTVVLPRLVWPQAKSKPSFEDCVEVITAAGGLL